MLEKKKHIGKQLLRITLHAGIEPLCEAIAPPGCDVTALTAAIENAIERSFVERFPDGEFAWSMDKRPTVEIRVCDILTPEDEQAKWNKMFPAPTAEQRAAASAAHEAALDAHPDNGKAGWWHVSGIRHDGYVKSSSAREAIEKAIAAGAVGDWEIGDAADARFIGENPEVLG